MRPPHVLDPIDVRAVSVWIDAVGFQLIQLVLSSIDGVEGFKGGILLIEFNQLTTVVVRSGGAFVPTVVIDADGGICRRSERRTTVTA